MIAMRTKVKKTEGTAYDLDEERRKTLKHGGEVLRRCFKEERNICQYTCAAVNPFLYTGSRHTPLPGSAPPPLRGFEKGEKRVATSTPAIEMSWDLWKVARCREQAKRTPCGVVSAWRNCVTTKHVALGRPQEYSEARQTFRAACVRLRLNHGWLGAGIKLKCCAPASVRITPSPTHLELLIYFQNWTGFEPRFG